LQPANSKPPIFCPKFRKFPPTHFLVAHFSQPLFLIKFPYKRFCLKKPGSQQEK
jgi:hypothetical protein